MSVRTLEEIVVTGNNFEHLFGEPITLKGNSQHMAEVVIQGLNRFWPHDNIIAISLYTTVSNTGHETELNL